MPFSSSQDPTLISDFNVSSRWRRAAHQVSLAITAGSPCGCSAAYSPSAYLKLSLFHLPFLYLSFFLSIGRLRADRCEPWKIGAPWGMPFPVACSLICLFHPVPALRHQIFVFDLSSQRNKIKKSDSFSRLMRSLILSGGLPSNESRSPSIPFKLDPALSPRLSSCPCYARRQQPWPYSLKGSIRSPPKSSCFWVYRFDNKLSWIPWISPSHRQQSALIPWCQRASSCLLSCPKTFSHWRKTLPLKAVQLLSLSRLPRKASVPRGLDRLG